MKLFEQEVTEEVTEVVDETTGDEAEVITDEVVDNPETEESVVTEEEEQNNLYTQEQVESAVKTRVNTFNRKVEKLKPYETAVKKISELTGLNVNDLISRLESMSLEEQASILKVPVSQLLQQRQVTEAQRKATEQANKYKLELEEQKLVSNPKFRDFALYKEEAYDLIEENPKLTLKQAYMLAKGDNATAAAARDAEQRAIAKMTKSSNQAVVKPGPTTPDKRPKIAPTTVEAAKRVGMDPAEYSAYANITSFEEYEKLRKKE